MNVFLAPPHRRIALQLPSRFVAVLPYLVLVLAHGRLLSPSMTEACGGNWDASPGEGGGF